jgi:agmatine deiminase
MMQEGLTERVVITSHLARDHPEIVNAIKTNCEGLSLLDGANDYWCRDFLPVPVTAHKFLQFTFDPPYYKYPGYTHLKTNTKELLFLTECETIKSPIVLDGGNIVYYERKAILTDSIFKLNPSILKTSLLIQLQDLLELEEVIIIPTLPYDITGHSDGMVRFVNEGTVLVNDFSKACSRTYWQKLLKSLQQFEICLLPNNSHLNKITYDATGDYINMLETKSHLFVPIYSNQTDDLALKLIERAYPTKKMVPVNAGRLTIKGGGLHCASWNAL